MLSHLLQRWYIFHIDKPVLAQKSYGEHGSITYA